MPAPGCPEALASPHENKFSSLVDFPGFCCPGQTHMNIVKTNLHNDESHVKVSKRGCVT